MYDFYPEWGPTRHRDTDDEQPAMRRPRYWQAAPAAVLTMVGGPEARDAEGLRPDDN